MKMPHPNAARSGTIAGVGRSAHRCRATSGSVQPAFRKGVQIRRALQADAAAIRELTRSAYAKWIPVIGRLPTPMLADYDRGVREHMIDFLFIGATLVGLIETKRESDHLLVVNLAVSPAFQGRGYGRVLLDYAEQLAGSLRLPEVKLFTNKQFTTNVEFYMRRGYTIDGEEPFMGGFLVHFAKRTVIS
jgi:GNAT superfamily N-acetyltransferase